MAAPDVHQLINLRGYGNAEKELRKAGVMPLDPINELVDALEKVADDLDLIDDENDNPNCDPDEITHFVSVAQTNLEIAITASMRIKLENHK